MMKKNLNSFKIDLRRAKRDFFSKYQRTFIVLRMVCVEERCTSIEQLDNKFYSVPYVEHQITSN